jgi:hypothetical protein
MAVNPLEGFEEVDFIVLSEDYSRFLIVPDGTTLKAKIVLRKIFLTVERTPEGYPVSAEVDAMNVISSMVPSSSRRQPSTEPWIPQHDKGEEMKFEEQDVKTQEYMTPNGFKLTVKPVLAKVFRYQKYNTYGEPIYTASLQSIVNIDKIPSTST